MLYDKYTNRIKDTISKQKSLRSSFASFTGDIPSEVKQGLIVEQREFLSMNTSLTNSLGNILTATPTSIQSAKLGEHPDFKHLKNTNQTEYHYITSIFIDIKGSTNLFKVYDNEIVYVITNTIQSAAIQTCLALGGHVQRLQGDGVFAYFGGKSIDPKHAVHKALTACSMFTYFVENDLKNIFEEDGIEDIKTRIGIDFGDDKDVLWANFGVMDVSELTTLSLHTSLASKMQAYAKSNGIVIGKNVIDNGKIPNTLYDWVKDSNGNIRERYIFKNEKKGFYYSQHSFDWFNYLCSLPNIVRDINGKLSFRPNPLDELREKTNLINSGMAFLNKKGDITSDNSGVPHQKHSFHYEK